jgi:hypothetical protein
MVVEQTCFSNILDMTSFLEVKPAKCHDKNVVIKRATRCT